MNIGDKVFSKLHKDKGVGIIVNISNVFNETYVEILFGKETIRTRADDLEVHYEPEQIIENNKLDSVENFLLRNLLLKIDENLTEDKIVTSTNFKIKPLPHQILTVNFVINRLKPRCLIADEVGLGKTIEAALAYEEFKLRGIVKRVLIVAPSSLVIQWQAEMKEKFNEDFVIFTKPYIKTLKETYGKETNVWSMFDKIIVSIDSVKGFKISNKLPNDERKRREWHNKYIVQHLIEAGFDMVVIDEAHKLSKYKSGTTTARYKLAYELSQSVPILLLLSATPHQGKSDLFLNLLKLLDPVIFTNHQSLRPEIVSEVAVRNKKRAVVDFNGNRIFKNRIPLILTIKRDNEKNRDEIKLYEMITKYTSEYYNLASKTFNLYTLLVMLYQRMASSSSFAVLSAMKRRLDYLNEGANNFDEYEITEELGEISIDEVIKNAKSPEIDKEKMFLSQCIKLAKDVSANYSDIKFSKMLDIIEETIKREGKPDLKFIIFTEFKATQRAIIQYLEKYGYRCSYINGDLSREEKIEQIDEFKNNKQILVSTDAGGEGINLQFCYCMINFDLPWNPSRLEQRIGRIDRIGQKNDVLIFNFHLEDTVEDKIRRMLENKLSLISKEFGEDKYADVLSLLDEEFSFDRLYIDAITTLKNKEKEFDSVAERIYNRAKEILEKDEMLLPFTSFSEDASEYLNDKINNIVKDFVVTYLKKERIDIETYKDKKLLRFKNPLSDIKSLPSTFKHVTFDADIALDDPKAELINIEHPFFNGIVSKVRDSEINGVYSAIKIKINKFIGKSGYWFIYRLDITNNINKQRVKHISIFMEDENFYNSRISAYLDEHPINNYETISNFSHSMQIKALINNAYGFAEEKAKNVFEDVKFNWLNDIDRYQAKLKDYIAFKKAAIGQIKIDNIRESKLKSLENEYNKQILFYEQQKNIVPKLELYQTAYVEFC